MQSYAGQGTPEVHDAWPATPAAAGEAKSDTTNTIKAFFM